MHTVLELTVDLKVKRVSSFYRFMLKRFSVQIFLVKNERRNKVTWNVLQINRFYSWHRANSLSIKQKKTYCPRKENSNLVITTLQVSASSESVSCLKICSASSQLNMRLSVILTLRVRGKCRRYDQSLFPYENMPVPHVSHAPSSSASFLPSLYG